MANLKNKAPKTPRKPKATYSIRVQSGGRITIPADVRNYYGLLPGKKVRLTIRKDVIYLKKE